MPGTVSAEQQRLAEAEARTKHWKRWGPYLAERAWGTVREDYSAERRLRGSIFRTIMRAPAPIAGPKTAFSASAITINIFALRWPFGTARIPF